MRARGPSLLFVVLSLGAAGLLPARAWAQAGAGASHVTFWRGDLRVFATRDATEVSVRDVDTGALLDPAQWSGNFATNPFVLRDAGDSFEASSLGPTHRVRVTADVATGPREDEPIVVWTGDLADALVHPAAPPPDSNAWMSYIPDRYQTGMRFGSEIGTRFLGFTTRDLWIIVQAGTDPAQVSIEDLATNVDADSDDTVTLDETSPELVHRDAEIAAFHLGGFEDDTVLVTTSHPASVLAGISSTAFPDWMATPPSYHESEHGRELGTLFHAYVSRWLTILPVLDDTTVRVTDLTDGDDTATFTLANGDRDNPLDDIYVADPLGRIGQQAQPRAGDPSVAFYFPPGGPIDDDLIRIESDRPVLVQVGPIASDTHEFADVALSVPTGPISQLILACAQNGGAEDFQVFTFLPNGAATITSLSVTQGFRDSAHHDFDFALPIPTPWAGGNMATMDWYWSGGIWAGELLRIEAGYPVQVMAGDYDGPNFGAFIPHVVESLTLPPPADAGPDLTVCPGQTVTLDGTGSFDGDAVPGPGTPTWRWDLDVAVDSSGNGVPDDDVDATGPTVTTTFPAGTTTVKLTYVDDDGEVAVDFVTVTAVDLAPPAVTCSFPIDAWASSLAGAMASPLAFATDECDPRPAITNDRTAGGSDATDLHPCGVTGVTFTATDEAGSSATCHTFVVVRPDRLSPAVGLMLRVSRDALDRPVLDWTRAGAPPTDALHVVLRGLDPRGRRGLRPRLGPTRNQLLTDGEADGWLLMYDVRGMQCDGQLSRD